jgi:ABC-2 type transport system permease protein
VTVELTRGARVRASAPAAISVQRVGKSFRLPHQRYVTLKERVLHPSRPYGHDELRALDGVSLEVRRGEFLGIMGRNGSGKSTLLKCIAGIYDVEEGSVQVEGRLSPVIELGVGFAEDLAVRDNVLLNAIMLGLSAREAANRVDEIIHFAELDDFRELQLKNYSSGMRARLAFSIAIRVDADILLIDEVLAVGDASFKEKCFEKFDEMRAEGRTLVHVSHERETVESFCDRALLLEQGRIISAGDPAAIGAEYEAVSRRGALHRVAESSVEPAAGTPDRHREDGRRRFWRPAPQALGEDLRYFATLTYALARTDFKVHYLGSMLGYVWALLRPLMMFGVLFFMLTKVLAFGGDVKHYAVYLLTAIMLFTYFSESTSSAVTCLAERQSLLRKIRFPRMAIPMSVALTALFNLAVNLLAVFAFVFIEGVEPRTSWLELPLLVCFLAFFATGLSLLLSALYVRFRDTGQLWAVSLQMLFYASPVLYVITRVPDSVRSLAAASPLAVVFTQTRHALIDPHAPTAADAIGSTAGLLVPVAIVIGVFALGLWLFNREAPRIAERV